MSPQDATMARSTITVRINGSPNLPANTRLVITVSGPSQLSNVESKEAIAPDPQIAPTATTNTTTSENKNASVSSTLALLADTIDNTEAHYPGFRVFFEDLLTKNGSTAAIEQSVMSPVEKLDTASTTNAEAASVQVDESFTEGDDFTQLVTDEDIKLAVDDDFAHNTDSNDDDTKINNNADAAVVAAAENVADDTAEHAADDTADNAADDAVNDADDEKDESEYVVIVEKEDSASKTAENSDYPTPASDREIPEKPKTDCAGTTAESSNCATSEEWEITEATEKPTPDITNHRFEDYIEVRNSHHGGFGVFAVRKINAGEVVLAEHPLLKTDAWAMWRDFAALSEEDQQALKGLWHRDVPSFDLLDEIRKRNSFQLPGCFGIFKIASRFNHACPSRRNVDYIWVHHENKMVFTANKTIEKDTELTVSYGGSPSELYGRYGFACRCGGCAGFSQKEIRELRQYYRELGVEWDWEEA